MKLAQQRKFEKISFDRFTDTFKDAYQEDYPDVSLEDYYSNFPLPQRATKKSAGYDIYAPFSFELAPGEEILVPTGLRVSMQPNEVLFILPRSGQGFKTYARLANTVGVIDADYYEADNEGQVFVKLRNESGISPLILDFVCLVMSLLTQILGSILPDEFDSYAVVKAVKAKVGKTLEVKAGQGFAQAIFLNYLLVDSDSVEVGEDRTGGFGSTGIK
jgi:dUTP pyrophosphatase